MKQRGPLHTILVGTFTLAGTMLGNEGGPVNVTEFTFAHPFIKAGDVPLITFAGAIGTGPFLFHGMYCTDGVLHLEYVSLNTSDTAVAGETFELALLRSTGLPGAVAVTGQVGNGPAEPLKMARLSVAVESVVVAGGVADIPFDTAGATPDLVIGAPCTINTSFLPTGLGVICWFVPNAFTVALRVRNLTAADITVAAGESVLLAAQVTGRALPGVETSLMGSPAGHGNQSVLARRTWLPQVAPTAAASITTAGTVVALGGATKLPAIPQGRGRFWAWTLRNMPAGLFGISNVDAAAGGAQLTARAIPTTGPYAIAQNALGELPFVAIDYVSFD